MTDANPGIVEQFASGIAGWEIRKIFWAVDPLSSAGKLTKQQSCRVADEEATSEIDSFVEAMKYGMPTVWIWNGTRKDSAIFTEQDNLRDVGSVPSGETKNEKPDSEQKTPKR